MVVLYKSKDKKKFVLTDYFRINLIFSKFIKFISNFLKFKKQKVLSKNYKHIEERTNFSIFQKLFFQKFYGKIFWLLIFLAIFSILIAVFNNYFSNPLNLHNLYSNRGYHKDGFLNWHTLDEPLEIAHSRLFSNVPNEYLNALLRTNKFPDINININFMSFEKIKKERQEALISGYHNPSIAKYVKASINYQGKDFKVKLKLKGWLSDHWNDYEKWSFKVKSTGKNKFMGMSSFSIQHPKTREYQYEKIVLSAAKSLDLLAPRLFFVNVFINGKSIGIMNVEEEITKEFIESNSKKEGIFTKLKFLPTTPFDWFEVGSKERSILINSRTRTNVISKNKNLDAPFFNLLQKTANSLLRGVLQGDLDPKDVFDIEQTGKYLAFTNFTNSRHALAVPNQNYYFNPVTYKFEPIVSETLSNWGATKPTQLLWEKIKNERAEGFELWNLIKSDRLIYDSFKQHMDEILAKIQNGTFIKESEVEEDFLQLKKEFLFLPYANFKAMQNMFTELTYPALKKYELSAYQEGPHRYKTKINSKEGKDKKLSIIAVSNLVWNEDRPSLEITNLLPEDIIIEEINVIKSTKKQEVNFPYSSYEGLHLFSNKLKSDAIASSNKTIKPFFSYSNTTLPKKINATAIHGKPKILSIPLKNIKKEDNLIIFGTAKRTMDEKEYIFYTYDYDYIPVAKYHPIHPQTIENILSKNKFLSYDKNSNILKVIPGKWRVDTFIITPPKTTFFIPSGSNLIFDKEAGILIRGNLIIEGELDKKVILEPANRIDSWRGITVLKSNFYSRNSDGNYSKSLIKNAIIKDTNFAKHISWELTGGVTFYEADVDIVNTEFIGTIAEDELNIVRSKFALENVKFSNTRSDAFDSDFSNGHITNSFFNNIGGDGIDFSGSNVSANKVFFEEVNDKAISIGEASKFNGTYLTIKSSGTGLACKDGSDAIITNSKFIDISHAILMAYIKKYEFSGAKIIANKINYKKKKDDILVQKGSTVLLDGKSIKKRKIDVEKLYKEGYMKK